jgi:hypothetical protein
MDFAFHLMKDAIILLYLCDERFLYRAKRQRVVLDTVTTLQYAEFSARALYYSQVYRA